MIYQYTKRYLKDKYKEPTENFQWKNLDNLNFLHHIQLRYSDAVLKKEIQEVKEAFKDFFEPIGTLLFRYTEEYGVRFKIFPYRVKPQDSEHLESIIKIIKKNKKHIQVCYKGQENQIAILGKIRRDIDALMFDSEESVHKKELTKYAIKKALHLNEKDIVVELKRIYIVKIFDENAQEEVLETPLESTDTTKTHNGYAKENIEKSYNAIFKKADIKEFIQNALAKTFQDKLDFASISHDYYEKKSLKIIHAQMSQDLSYYSAFEEDYLSGIATYILRNHIYHIHEIMTEKLLQEIYHKNQNATDFLLQFNGSIILHNGQKYKLPSLQDKHSQKISSAMITSTAFLYINIQNKIQTLKEKLTKLQKKIINLEFASEENAQLESLYIQEKNIKYDIVCYEKDLLQKQEQIESVKQAITTVLMSRKKPLGTSNA